MKRSSVILLLFFLFCFACFSSYGQTSIVCPPNIGLEMGNFTNWKLYTGSCCPINANTLQAGPVNNRHVITSGTGVDPYGGFPIVAPGGGVYSMRLGNDNVNSQAERARYYVQVPAGVNNYSIIFRYAVVFEDPGHDTSEQPRFEVKAYDSATNIIVPCSYFKFVASSALPGFLQAGSTSTSTIWYKSWTTASIDLSNYAGRTVAVDFASGDCSLGAHFGYGYVDLNCGLLPTNTVVCSTSPTFSITAPPGFQDYEWRDSTLTTLLDTGQVGVFNTPTANTKYAVILNPYTGFGCPDTIFTQVTVSSTSVNITNNDTTVCNGTTLQLNTSTVATSTPITYSWTPTTGLSCSTCANPVVTLPVNNKYYVTATNGDGCPRKDSITIRASNISVATTKQRVSCFGLSDGMITATPSGGKIPYSYNWTTTPVQTTATATGLAAGTYTVTVTDSLGCTKSATDSVKQPALLTATTTQTNVSCFGGNNGTAAALPAGGTAPFTYSWTTTPVKTTAIVSGLAAGTYTVTVTDSSGCTTTASVTITQPTQVTATTTKTDVSCFGGNNGTATAVPAGGTGPYTYSWNTSPAKTTVTATGLSAGTYTVTVKDANNCTTTATATIGQPAALTATTTKVNVSCNGGNDGTATAIPSGGTSPYTYSWNTTPAQTTITAIGLSVGTYTVTVTDANNCTTTATATITQPTAVTATTTKTDVSCNGGSNGTATVTAGGGTAPYSYSWNTTPAQTTATATGLAAGTYTVTVTDNQGCIKTATATIGQPTALAATATNTDVSCNGGANGTATVTASGGTSPYSYSWNTTPVKTTATATGLAAGTYTVTVTDNKGCVTTATATVGQPTVLSASTTKTDVSCNGGNNGTATATASGGTSPYTYSWNTLPVKTAATATGLSAGTYTVTVTDNKGCVTTATATIGQPTAVSATISKTNVSCNGGSNGTATVTAGGGTAPYTYSWNTGPVQTTSAVTGLAAGTYTVTVTDANNCTITASTTITQPAVLTATTSKTDVSCNGGSNGTATVTAGGGTAPYTYSWNTTPAQTTATATGLAAGTYTVTVTDNQGCVKTAMATIGEPTALAASATNTDVSCNNGANGTATATASGGTSPYTYSWNTTPVKTTATATGLAAGTYTVTVTDNKGCVTTAIATVGQPTALSASTTKTDVSCNGGNNGTATVTASGGTSPYTYSWNTSPAKTGATATGLSAGTYTVTVTDNKGCVTTATATIGQPAAVSATISKTNVSCNGGSNGTATVTAGGGTAPYTYSWNTTPVQTGATATGLSIGTYTVTVTDANNCVGTASTTITQPPVLNVTTTKTDVSCNTGNDGMVAALPTGGTAPYTYSWNTTPVSTTSIVTGLPAGTYTVTVTDANGCTKTATATVIQPSGLSATATKTDVSCFGGNNGTATVTPIGGAGPYTYSWNTTPVKTTATATGLAAGTYTVTVTDNNGCITIATAIVGQPTQVSATTTKTDASCYGGNNGTATAVPVGGTAPYTYSWNTTPPKTTITATGLSAGTYIVTVTDNKGCVTTASATVGQPAPVTGTTTKTDALCNGSADGTATVTPAGGTGPYTYSWNTSPAQTGATATGLAAGTYTVTITDANNCTGTATATIGQPTPVTASTTKTNVSCNGGSNGTATATGAGGTAPYTYSWNTTPVQTTATATGLPIGTYTVTVTDAHGCTKTASATITQPTPLTATTTKTDATCFSGANGTATAVPTGGVGPYTYSWNTTPVQTTVTATGLANGTYIVTVTDANGCTTTANVTIGQPNQLNASAVKTDVSCFNGSNGTATVTAAGGITPYAYSWNTIPPKTTATATNLAAGTYTVTVTDNQNCVVTVSITVGQPTQLTAATTKTDVSCNGGANGTATVTGAGGIAPYTYSWNTTPAQTTATATGLVAGTYTATVTDSKGCVTTVNAVIGQPTVLTSTMSKTNVSCFGGSNGTATVTPQGGTPPYTYNWNTTPVKTTVTATGLAAGTYTVVVTDAKGCLRTDSIAVGQPTLLTATATKTDVSCFSGANGTASVTAGGGTAPYTYSWNTTPVQTGTTATGLPAGTYTVTVTDANGCTTTAKDTVKQPTLLAASTVKTNATCNGKANGTATVAAAGGTSPYTYSWNTTPVQTTAGATNMIAGAYTVTVTDAKGCVATATATITHPAPLLSMTTKVDANCYGDSNGTATVATTGGTSPYSYTWLTTPVVTTTTITGLPAGTYKVAVKDTNNCPDTATVIIGQPAKLAAVTSKVNVRCWGESSGSASVTVTGGTIPYYYAWNSTPSQTSATASSLPVGKYTVVVTDAHGCKVAAVTDSLQQPDPLLVSASGTKTCFGTTMGSASATALGGTAPYSFGWHTQPPQFGNNAGNLGSGIYEVQGSDANGCIDTASATVAEIPLPIVDGIGDATICEGGKVPLSVSGAKSYLWSPAGTLSCATCVTPIAFPPGTTTYTVVGTDTNNCSNTDRVVITVIPNVNSYVGPDIDVCIGDPVQLSAYGGMSYRWSPPVALSDSMIWNPVSSTDTTITYKVVIIENECFSDTLYQTVRVHQRPTVNLGPDKRGAPGAVIQLHADTTKAISIAWKPLDHLSCDSCIDPLATLYKTITYIATVTNGVCEDTDDIRIIVGCDENLFFIPNTFTPNGDGANDRFYPMAEGVTKVDKFSVYNRWGEVMHAVINFAPNDPAFGWDGRFKGADLPPDVYVWYLESKCSNGEKIFLKGDISLIR
ncbi:T9SS type B sorting domain-containing protein [Polluticoccus soli]|uniref:T9SS type B sorting domain-containing protein n=1 Tax=Polluticoccus soli TaxID=3034150 RepID=UPI0023E19E46|nr:T9SS type B sorting domain-containing protein [Flavipsychrobacter sp. JY13-12]